MDIYGEDSSTIHPIIQMQRPESTGNTQLLLSPAFFQLVVVELGLPVTQLDPLMEIHAANGHGDTILVSKSPIRLRSGCALCPSLIRRRRGLEIVVGSPNVCILAVLMSLFTTDFRLREYSIATSPW